MEASSQTRVDTSVSQHSGATKGVVHSWIQLRIFSNSSFPQVANPVFSPQRNFGGVA